MPTHRRRVLFLFPSQIRNHAATVVFIAVVCFIPVALWNQFRCVNDQTKNLMMLRNNENDHHVMMTTTATLNCNNVTDTNAVSGTSGSSSSSVNNKNREPSLLIVVLSGAALFEGRQKQRAICAPLYQQEQENDNNNNNNNTNNITLRFAVGRPSFDTRHAPDVHIQGMQATLKEQAISKSLKEEAEQYHDLIVTPNRDYYRDLNDKVLSVIRYGVQFFEDSKVVFDYIIKTDDEYCIDIKLLKRMIRQHETQHPHDELYIGYYLWQGTEYKIMAGPHNETAPFMSGWMWGISRRLAQALVSHPDDWIHNVLSETYGTSSDDANLGKWIAYAIQKYNISVQYVQNRNLVQEVDKII